MLSKLIIKYFKYAILLVLTALVCSVLFSCSPSKRLKRLIKKHPELLQRDTVYLPAKIPIPELRHDTDIDVNGDTTGLGALIAFYSDWVDSLTRQNIVRDVHHYYEARPVLKDTFVIPLKNGGFVKVFQKGKALGHVLFQPAYTLTVSLPARIDNVYKDIPWRLAWYWVVILVLCGVVVTIMILTRLKRPTTNTGDNQT